MILLADPDERDRSVACEQPDLEGLAVIEPSPEQAVDRRFGCAGDGSDPCSELFHADVLERAAVRSVEEPRQSGDAHERAEERLAVLGPVVGVRHAASRDGLGKGSSRPQGARRSDRRFERRPAGGRKASRSTGIEHGDASLVSAGTDGGVVEIPLDRDGDDRSVPGRDRRGGECRLARACRPDESDGATVALAASVSPFERMSFTVFGGQQRSATRHSAEQHPAGWRDNRVDDERTNVARPGLVGVGVLPEADPATSSWNHSTPHDHAGNDEARCGGQHDPRAQPVDDSVRKCACLLAPCLRGRATAREPNRCQEPLPQSTPYGAAGEEHGQLGAEPCHDADPDDTAADCDECVLATGEGWSYSVIGRHCGISSSLEFADRREVTDAGWWRQLCQAKFVDGRTCRLDRAHRMVERSDDDDGVGSDSLNPAPPAGDMVLSAVVVEGADAELDDVTEHDRVGQPPAPRCRVPDERLPPVGLVGVTPQRCRPPPDRLGRSIRHRQLWSLDQTASGVKEHEVACLHHSLPTETSTGSSSSIGLSRNVICDALQYHRSARSPARVRNWS